MPRISAGKLGRVERSLPKMALSLVKRSPVTCMPSPESPAKRITTWSISIDLAHLPAGAGPARHIILRPLPHDRCIESVVAVGRVLAVLRGRMAYDEPQAMPIAGSR